ncbi:integrin beta-1-like [Biomphalaria glabrata]|uniref:Integrin beta n=1 Tax=Biomphalaria glabrata TaxID=6526 RepID=A0A9W2YZS5_BIOGL|nr:integrin beta-1-like [Biomphalaria glabrata]XP_055868209.1 integrin beta-1-like [Biomphalaria glabrata]XP_055868214.1 integrin beta-1-like [Biomphalaria glabrata]
MMHQTLLVFFFCLFIAGIQTQFADDENPCTLAESCGACIRTSNKCAWCGAENFDKSAHHCDLLTTQKRRCEERYITYPQSEFKVDKQESWTSGDNLKPPVQVTPQQITWKIRPNDLRYFTLDFKQQDNYPVDLYFLLDLSFGVSKAETRPRLISLGEEIPKKMKGITNNFRLGFGTFVDKKLMPYIAWTPEIQEDRCQNPPCSDPHDFKNQLNISDSQTEFATQMKNALQTLSLNFDDAEGGIDGLIQALDCDSIGWRNISRRIIVYCSNSIFHLAGDGKFGGATRQSNLKCALKNNEYEYEKIYDYPSVSQLASKLREKKANVIFAVMDNVYKHYTKLAHLLDGAVVGVLQNQSENIVQLINDKYYELRSRIKFEPRNSDFVDIKFYSSCKDKSIERETSVCDNLEIGDVVKFNVSITVNSDICQGNTGGEVDKDVIIDAVGLNEQMLIQLKVICECECERAEHEIQKSDKCFAGNGTFECGVCNCNEGRYGRKCECDESEISSADSLKQCINPEKNDTGVCSSYGDCICGQCDCFHLSFDTAHRYSGQYCECNDYNCPYGPDGICGGKSKGSCMCGKCVCDSSWSGENCECSKDTKSCLASNGKVCNGFGDCLCGKCQCERNSGMVGPTCEDCPNCPSRCSQYIDCAQCKAHSSGKFNRFECDKSCQNVTLVDSLKSGKGIKECDGIDVDGCTFFFTYEYTPSNDVLIEAQKTKDCPAAANVAAIVGGTVAAVVLIPLLIICLIILIRNRRDAKEYADFMKERDRAKWESGANPIYKDPKSTFKNPTYGGEK